MIKILLKKLISLILILGVLGFTSCLDINIVNAKQSVKIRQEINITDAYFMSGSGAYATSSARAYVDTTKYSSAQYYFEVVASTTGATNSSVYLKNASTSAIVATLTVNSVGSYTRYRTAFNPVQPAQEYMVVTGNEATQKGVKAARIIVLQNDPDGVLDTTETQIELGNEETYTYNAATTTFASPKYWFYDSSKWDGSPTFFAEVTYNEIRGVASSTLYTEAKTSTVITRAGVASTSVGLWGGGGAGGYATLNTGGGGGGAGGQFASSTMLATSSTYTLVVGAGGTVVTDSAGNQGASSTWASSMVIAGGGAGGSLDAAGTSTGTVNGCVGTICFRGGNGGNGRNPSTQYGGGGGGGAGTTGNGADSTGAGAAGGATLTGGGAGATKNVTAGSIGATGSQAGGGGAGGNASNATNRAGGPGGAGQAYITQWVATTSITVEMSDGSGDNFVNWSTVAVIVPFSGRTGEPLRVRSAAFVPTSGRNYRIAFRSLDNRTTIAVYNAKIIVDQTNPTLLEPQYLQANTKLLPGTSQQSFLTLWDSSEWNTTNTYLHQLESANGSASVAELDVAGGAQITGSVVSSPDNRGASLAMIMPTNGNIDVKATTNNNDIYCSRILVQVSMPGAPSEGNSSGPKFIDFLGARIRMMGGRILYR